MSLPAEVGVVAFGATGVNKYVLIVLTYIDFYFLSFHLFSLFEVPCCVDGCYAVGFFSRSLAHSLCLTFDTCRVVLRTYSLSRTLPRGGSGGVPLLPESWNQLWDGQPRDFKTFAPDLVIYNEGTAL